VNRLKKWSHRAEFRMKLMIANRIVMGKIAYGIAVWGNCPEYLKNVKQNIPNEINCILLPALMCINMAQFVPNCQYKFHAM
jgi:hypothetical protein